jgi:hypothetical protein
MFPTELTQIQPYDIDDGKALFPILKDNYIYYITEHKNNIYKIDVNTGNKSIAFATSNQQNLFYRALFKTTDGNIVYIEVPYWSSVTAKMYIFLDRDGQLIWDTETGGYDVPIRTSYDSPPAKLNFKITPYLVGNTVGLCCTTKNSNSLYTIYNSYNIYGYKNAPEYSKFEPQYGTVFSLFEHTVNDFTNGDNYYAGLYNIYNDNYMNKMFRVSFANNEFISTQLDTAIDPSIQLTSTSFFKVNDDIYFNSSYNNYIFKYDTTSNEIVETDNVASEANLNFCYNDVFVYTVSATEMKIYRIFNAIVFSIFNYKNEKVLAVPSLYPIKGLIFTKNADNITVTIITKYSREEYPYVVVEPLYKEIVGYGYNQDEIISFYFDTTYNVDIKTNTELYEEYQVIDGTPTKFAINLYKNSAESMRVDKSNYLTLVSTINGTLREEASLINPIITIQYNDVPNFNYIYIPIFNRYYYIEEIINIRNNLWEIHMAVDVLMSYKTQIKQQTAIVERQQYRRNTLLVDNEIKPTVNYYSNIIPTYENPLFADTNHLGAFDHIVLQVVTNIGVPIV